MKIRLLASAAVLALAVSACGSAESSAGADEKTEPTTEPTTSEATPSEPTATEPTATETTGSAPSGDMTAPGTELGLGEWATVPFSYGTDQEGVLRARVTKVDTGTEKDLSVFNQSTRNKLKGFTPKYVRVEVEQVSGGALEFASASTNFRPITSSGEQAQELSAFGSFEPCDSESFPSGWGPGSPAVDICVIGLVPGGGEDVVGAMYVQRDSDYDSYEGKPVLWK